MMAPEDQCQDPAPCRDGVSNWLVDNVAVISLLTVQLVAP